MLVLLTGMLAACGRGEDADSSAGQTCPAAPAAMPRQPELPTGFPSPSEVTYTEERDRPVADRQGYWEGDIGAAFDGYKEPSRHRLLGHERRARRGRRGGELLRRGGLRTVRLLESCKDRTDVSITIRPS